MYSIWIATVEWKTIDSWSLIVWHFSVLLWTSCEGPWNSDTEAWSISGRGKAWQCVLSLSVTHISIVSLCHLAILMSFHILWKSSTDLSDGDEQDAAAGRLHMRSILDDSDRLLFKWHDDIVKCIVDVQRPRRTCFWSLLSMRLHGYWIWGAAISPTTLYSSLMSSWQQIQPPCM